VYAASINGHTHVVQYLSSDMRLDALSMPLVGIDASVKQLLLAMRRTRRTWTRRSGLWRMASLRQSGRAQLPCVAAALHHMSSSAAASLPPQATDPSSAGAAGTDDRTVHAGSANALASSTTDAMVAELADSDGLDARIAWLRAVDAFTIQCLAFVERHEQGRLEFQRVRSGGSARFYPGAHSGVRTPRRKPARSMTSTQAVRAANAKQRVVPAASDAATVAGRAGGSSTASAAPSAAPSATAANGATAASTVAAAAAAATTVASTLTQLPPRTPRSAPASATSGAHAAPFSSPMAASVHIVEDSASNGTPGRSDTSRSRATVRGSGKEEVLDGYTSAAGGFDDEDDEDDDEGDDGKYRAMKKRGETKAHGGSGGRVVAASLQYGARPSPAAGTASSAAGAHTTTLSSPSSSGAHWTANASTITMDGDTGGGQYDSSDSDEGVDALMQIVSRARGEPVPAVTVAPPDSNTDAARRAKPPTLFAVDGAVGVGDAIATANPHGDPALTPPQRTGSLRSGGGGGGGGGGDGSRAVVAAGADSRVGDMEGSHSASASQSGRRLVYTPVGSSRGLSPVAEAPTPGSAVTETSSLGLASPQYC